MESKLLTAERFVDEKTGCTYRYVVSDTEYFRPHYHDYCEIFLILEGQARHLVNGAELPLQPGDLVFIRPRDDHNYEYADGTGFSMLNITFTWETVQEIFSFLGSGFPSNLLCSAPLPPTVHLSGGEVSAINSRMQGICSMPPDQVEPLKTALRVLIFDLLTKYFSSPIRRNDTVPSWLEELCRQMRAEGNFIEGSERLFALTDKSREHVCRSMKKHMGLTVTEFINDLRLNYIAHMLQNSNHSVTEIIFESGFNNISWANNLFKKKYGVTMRLFRERKNALPKQGVAPGN